MKSTKLNFKDYSLHFTLKGQTMEQIKEALKVLMLAEDFKMEPMDIMHHCFLPRIKVEERGRSTEIIDFLRSVEPYNRVCWYGVTEGDGTVIEDAKRESLYRDRWLMLTNLKRVNGVAIFIGAQIDGVAEEYNMAKEMGIEILQIHIFG